MGLAFYVTRMSTGLLVVCMVVHALWDFAQLGTTATGGTAKPVAGLLGYAAFLAALVGVFFVV
jgi:lipid-binding SYLF domain-containing protein